MSNYYYAHGKPHQGKRFAVLLTPREMQLLKSIANRIITKRVLCKRLAPSKTS